MLIVLIDRHPFRLWASEFFRPYRRSRFNALVVQLDGFGVARLLNSVRGKKDAASFAAGLVEWNFPSSPEPVYRRQR